MNFLETLEADVISEVEHNFAPNVSENQIRGCFLELMNALKEYDVSIEEFIKYLKEKSDVQESTEE